MVTRPALQAAADSPPAPVTTESSTAAVAATPAAVSLTAPATPVITAQPSTTDAAKPVDTAKAESATVSTEKTTTLIKTANAQGSHQRRAHVRDNDSLDLGG